MTESVKEHRCVVYVNTIEENEDQYSRNFDKPPTATTSNTNWPRSFTISMM